MKTAAARTRYSQRFLLPLVDPGTKLGDSRVALLQKRGARCRHFRSRTADADSGKPERVVHEQF